jgi:hypothetical protein
MKRDIRSFVAKPDVASLLEKEMVRRVGRRGNRRGLLGRIINEALRSQLAYLKGKREA